MVLLLYSCIDDADKLKKNSNIWFQLGKSLHLQEQEHQDCVRTPIEQVYCKPIYFRG